MAETRIRGRRAFSIGSVLSRSFSIWGRNIIPFTILSVIVYLPLVAFLVLTAPGDSTMPSAVAPADQEYGYSAYEAEDQGPSLAVTLVTLAFFMVLPYVVAGALIYGVLQQLHGEPASMGSCLRVGFARMFPVIGVGLIAGLLSFLGALALIIPGIIIACMYWVAVPVAVVERPGLIASLRRSAQLTKGEKGSIFAIVLLLFAMSKVTEYVAEKALSPENLTAEILVSLIPTVAFGMLGAIATAVGYHDLRLAKEGVRIDQLVSVFA